MVLTAKGRQFQRIGAQRRQTFLSSISANGFFSAGQSDRFTTFNLSNPQTGVEKFQSTFKFQPNCFKQTKTVITELWSVAVNDLTAFFKHPNRAVVELPKHHCGDDLVWSNLHNSTSRSKHLLLYTYRLRCVLKRLLNANKLEIKSLSTPL